MPDDELDKLTKGDGGDVKTAQAFERLAGQLQSEQDGRKEDRFMFTLGLVVLADALIFTHMGNWGGPVVIGVIELFGLLIFARRCGVEEVQLWIDKVLNAVKPGS